jgi:hypothetical protein
LKLRIKGNSIRLRLLRSEVERFASTGRISEETHFGPHGSPVLRYTLLTDPTATEISTAFENNEISVVIPETLVREWATGDVVGLERVQQANGNGGISVLIEKDFACLDRPDDPDRDDAFSNPNPVCNEDD